MRRTLAVTVLLAAACGGPGTQPITELPRELTTGERALIAADNRFAFALLRSVVGGAEGANVFLSPLSVGMALGMAYNGAAGATRDDMATTLGLDGLSLDEVDAAYRSVIDLLRNLDPSVEFAIANSIWHRLEVQLAAEFLDRAATYFDATVQGLDFTSADAAATINAWVSSETRGRISEIVTPPIPASTIAYLVNAIYFNGAWSTRFDRDRTAPGAFQLREGGTRTVPLMHSTEPVPLWHTRDADVEIGELPYGGGAFRMTLVVPTDPAAIDGLAAALTQERWDGWVSRLDSTELDVTLPRFTMTFDRELSGDLSGLGMASAFCDDPEARYDFTAMYPPGGACISAVKHRSFVEVNEEGTEAAAVTSVEIGVTSAPLTFVVDRPFLFAIREVLTGTILFLGVVTDPGT